MQTMGKANHTEESVIQAKPVAVNFQCLTMPKRLGLFTFAMTAGLMLTAGSVLAEPSFPALTAANSPVENTGQNVRDRGDTTLTPEDQKETSGDIDLTAAIRRTVVRNKSLSLDAHNAKIITRNGVVTLRGPVETLAEKAKLQKIAQQTRGVKQVDNQLEIKTP